MRLNIFSRVNSPPPLVSCCIKKFPKYVLLQNLGNAGIPCQIWYVEIVVCDTQLVYETKTGGPMNHGHFHMGGGADENCLNDFKPHRNDYLGEPKFNY